MKVEPREPPPVPGPHAPRAPVVAQACPVCRHPVVARLESRAHEWMVEHWVTFHWRPCGSSV